MIQNIYGSERGKGNMREVLVMAADGGDDQAKETDAQSESWSEIWVPLGPISDER